MLASLTKPGTLGVGFTVLVMTWLAAAGDTWSTAFSFTGQKADYYNLLVDGFMDGQLHLKAEVHPDRLNPDPEVRKRAPYLLDAGFYQGKYYLYYGVVPAVTVLLPYSLITGHDLGLNIATLGFALVGFGISLRWYRDLQRHCFPISAQWIDTLVVLILAFGPATTFLVRRSAFYELPLAAGYAFFCGFVWTSTRALTSSSNSAKWIAASSLSVGFAAGCHPNYALLSLLVALTAWWSRQNRAVTSSAGLAGAAVLPAAILGAALAWYNHARFGNPLEFGFNYGVNVFFETGDKLVSAAFIWPNLKWYYLTPPSLLPYFPFAFPAAATFRPVGYHGAEAIHGQFLVLLLLAWILVGAIAFSRPSTWPSGLRRITLLLLSAFAMNAAFILFLGIRANRYMVDFQAPLIALGVLAAGYTFCRAVSGYLRLAWLYVLTILTLTVVVFNTLAAFQQFDDFQNTRPREFELLSKSLNPSWTFWNRWGLVQTGPLVFDVTFKEHRLAVGEPLLTVGAPGYSDSVYAIQHPGNLVEFHIDHLGYGGPKSRLFPYEPGKVYTMEIDLGSFYPPATDPQYDSIAASLVNLRKTHAKIVFNEQVALDLGMKFHEAAPWQRDLGTNLVSKTAYSTQFSGDISNVRWKEPEALVIPKAQPALISLQAEVPSSMPTASQPLIGFGVSGRGHLLFLQPAGANGEWNLGLDEWGYGSQPSIPVSLSPGSHTVDLLVGPLFGTDPKVADSGFANQMTPLKNRLFVWIDGLLTADFVVTHHLDAFNQPSPGANIHGFSTSEANFYGEIRERAPAPDLYERLLETVSSSR